MNESKVLTIDNKEGKFDKSRRYLAYITYGVLGIGAVLTIFPATVLLGTAMVGGAVIDIATDQSIGKSISTWLKERKDKRK